MSSNLEDNQLARPNAAELTAHPPVLTEEQQALFVNHAPQDHIELPPENELKDVLKAQAAAAAIPEEQLDSEPLAAAGEPEIYEPVASQSVLSQPVPEARQSSETETVFNSEVEATAAADEQAYLAQLHELKEREQEAMAHPRVIEEMPSTYVNGWSLSGPFMALILFFSLMVVGVVAERSLNYYLPHKEKPKYGVVVAEPAAVSPPQPAYPVMMVQPSANPNQAPSPLPLVPPAQQRSILLTPLPEPRSGR